MALQSSGQISMGDINVELGRTRTAIISLDTAENGGYVTINARSTNKPSATNPATISEWYSYNHSGVTDTTPPTVPGTLTATNTVSSVTLNGVLQLIII
jgi:type II secretory pathway component PulC